MKARLQAWASALKAQTLTVYFAARDPATPWFVRVLGVVIAAYALSPIDLIPDFIPVLGILDYLLLLPLGLALVVRLVPDEVMERARRDAQDAAALPTSYAAALAVCVVWLVLAVAVLRWVLAPAAWFDCLPVRT